ncbi:MAG: metallophosphoesterase [Candidatus Binatia bacterium]
MLFDILFRSFFTAYAFAGGFSVAGLLFVLAAVAGTPVSAAVAVGAGAAAFAAFRLAALVFRRDPAHPTVLDRLGRATAAVAFVALGGAGALGVAALAWSALGRFGASAHAGMLLSAGSPGAEHVGLVASLAVALGAGTIVHGYLRGHRALRVRAITVPVAGLPAALAGLRLAHVSDLHLGPIADVRTLRTAIDRLLAIAPDVVCVTGDVVDNRHTDLPRWLPELARLDARHGVFAILGNHDRHAGAERVAGALTGAPAWRVLRNARTAIEVDGARLHLVGLEDHKGGRTEALLPLLAEVPAGEITVVLAHYPDTFRATAAAGVPLTLAGHTHGGQVAVPGLPKLNTARLLMTRWDGGLFAQGPALLHVSRGLGTSAQRIRVGVPPEITVLTLVPAAAVQAA